MRKDPTARLDRRTAGQWLHEPRVLAARLSSRQRELRQPRTILGTFKESRSFKIRKSRRTVVPGPYAPQLIRLVRYPFQLHAAAPRRVEGRGEVPWEEIQYARTTFASAAARTQRGTLFAGNPLRAIDLHPEVRPRISSQAWISRRGW